MIISHKLKGQYIFLFFKKLYLLLTTTQTNELISFNFYFEKIDINNILKLKIKTLLILCLSHT